MIDGSTSVRGHAWCACCGVPIHAGIAGCRSRRADHWKRLKALVEPRVAANPNDAEAQWLLSRVRMAYQDLTARSRRPRKRWRSTPKNADYHWQLAQVVGELASNASVFKQIGLAKRYKREVEAALAINPKHTGSLTGLMEFYNRAPGIVGGDKKKAASIAGPDHGHQQGGRLHRESPPADAVRIRRRSRRVSSRLWVQAVQADPTRFEPHINLASIYAGGTSPRWELAEKEALPAKKIDPDRTGAVFDPGRSLCGGERWAELDAILAEAEKDHSRQPDAVPARVDSAHHGGKDLARAERYARKYLSQEPEPNATTLAVAHWRLGTILEKAGQKPDAIAELQTALKLDPKFEQAQKDLKRLKAWPGSGLRA